MSAREIFVYYRVAGGDAARCADAVRAFQTRLAHDEPGLRARWLVRPETTSDGLETWMETYAVESASGDGVDPALEARIEVAASVLAPLIAGPRHVEVFIVRR